MFFRKSDGSFVNPLKPLTREQLFEDQPSVPTKQQLSRLVKAGRKAEVRFERSIRRDK